MLIKFWLGDDCRRLTVANHEPITFSFLMEKINNLFNLVEPVLIKYKDKEGDLITLVDQTDLEDILYNENNPNLDSALKFYLCPRLTYHDYIPYPSLELRPTRVTRSRFGSSYNEQEMLEILRDISLYICSRDLTPPGVRSWVSGEKNLITPDTAVGFKPDYAHFFNRRLARFTRSRPLEPTNPTQLLGNLSHKVTSWNVDQVALWLNKMEFDDVVPQFKAHDITGDVLLNLDHEGLKELGIKSLGRRHKLLDKINAIHQVLQSSNPFPQELNLMNTFTTELTNGSK